MEAPQVGGVESQWVCDAMQGGATCAGALLISFVPSFLRSSLCSPPHLRFFGSRVLPSFETRSEIGSKMNSEIHSQLLPQVTPYRVSIFSRGGRTSLLLTGAMF